MGFNGGQILDRAGFGELSALAKTPAIQDPRGNLERAARVARSARRRGLDFEFAVDHLLGIEGLADLHHRSLGQRRAQA